MSNVFDNAHGFNPYRSAEGDGWASSREYNQRKRLPKAKVVRWYWSDDIRMATVDCPFCGNEHDHVVPLDLAADAILRRTPKCDSKRPKSDYRLVLPENMTPGMDHLDALDTLADVSAGVDLTFEQSTMLLEIWTETPGMSRAKLLAGEAR